MELSSASGHPIRIGGHREHVVLALLALRANRVVSGDELIDAVWGERPPSTAKGQIQGCVSTLRKLFARHQLSAQILTQHPGYRLEVPVEALDVGRFERLVAEGRRQAARDAGPEAAAALREALSLWRGNALEGIASEVVERGAATLDDAHLSATDDYARVMLALGRHRELVGHLQEVVQRDGLREDSYGQLMLALYRSGRTSDALGVMRTARATLADELGLDPGPQLQALEARILRNDPSLMGGIVDGDHDDDRHPDVPVAGPEPASAWVSPRQLPRAEADFVARDEQIAEITALLRPDPARSADDYAVPIIGICGPGGVGKSALALRVAHEVAEHYPDGHLFVDLQGPEAEDRTTVLLARLLRALGLSGSAIPDDRDERAERFRSLVSGKRILVILDGVHSEQQILPLLPGSRTCAVIVATRTRLDLLTGARWFTLDVLDVAHSLELLGRIGGRDRIAAEPEAGSRLVTYAGGLPLALRIAGARLASRPHWRIAELTRRMENEMRRLDEFSHRGLELRSSLGTSFRALPGHAKVLFRLLALAQTSQISGWVAAALCDEDLDSAERSLEILLDAHLLEPVGAGEPRYRLHDLVRVYALELLKETDSPEAQEAALRRLLGAWLERTDRAHRAEYGGDYTTLHGSAPRYRAAGDDTLPEEGPLAWFEAERANLIAMVRLAAGSDLDEVCWDLALSMVSLFEVRAQYDDWRDTAELAAEVCERRGNLVGLAASHYSLGTLNHAIKDIDEAERHFAKALGLFTAVGHTHGEALTLRNAALVDRVRGDVAAMDDKCRRALEKMREVDDPIGEANVLRVMAQQAMRVGDHDLAGTLLADSLALCRAAGYRRGVAQVEARVAELHLLSGQTTQALQMLRGPLSTVRELGDRVGESHLLHLLGQARLRGGQTEMAETSFRDAKKMAAQTGAQVIEGRAAFELGQLEVLRGNVGAAVTELTRAREVFAGLGSALWHAKTLLLLAEVGDEPGIDALAGDIDLVSDQLASHEDDVSVQLRHQLAQVRAMSSQSSQPSQSSRP
ncbi:AfsR/SARP family transcriptional regulator [Nocardioides sp. GXZ039]|uniref:AfsR/SARP family transcriptional regulator n=1 Tax=Nocardioides sp. GXZ039 TaxID=3136018 RepID=UPI0030F42DC2